jgi:diguanylate cyclase (GGDEF)-like protein
MKEDRAFLGFSFLMLILALNQFGVSLQMFYLPIDFSAATLWFQIQYVAMSLMIFAIAFFIYLLLRFRLKTVVIFLSLIFSLILAPLVFTPYFGTIDSGEMGNLILTPGIITHAIFFFLCIISIYCVVLLFLPFLSGERGRNITLYLIFAFGGIILLILGAVEVVMDIGIIPYIPFRLFSLGAILWAFIGAAMLLIHFYGVKASLQRISVHLNETKKELAKKGKMAITDSLTGLYNRGFFDESLEAELQDSLKQNKSLSLLMMDLDGFKRINDKLGHQTGDTVLSEISFIIKRSSRASDLPARYGGEEFAVILPNTNIAEARMVGERIRQSIEDVNFILEGKPAATITISIGAAPLKATDLSDDLIKRADKALYTAKKRGGNKVSTAK